MQGLRTVYEVERESLASHACRAKGRDKFSPFLLFYPFHGHEYAGFYTMSSRYRVIVEEARICVDTKRSTTLIVRRETKFEYARVSRMDYLDRIVGRLDKKGDDLFEVKSSVVTCRDGTNLCDK